MPRSAFLHHFSQSWLKPLTLAVLVTPGLYVAFQWVALLAGWPNAMGINPVEWTHHFLGATALRILLATLMVTPLRQLTGWGPLIRIRRRLGLAAFIYAVLHLLAYFGLDLFFSLAKLWADTLKRTYIALGMASLALMLPLAITSTNGMIRRLGAIPWRRLHWLVYPAVAAAVLHHVFKEKVLTADAAVHLGVLAVLLGYRIYRIARPFRPRAQRKAEAAAA